MPPSSLYTLASGDVSANFTTSYVQPSSLRLWFPRHTLSSDSGSTSVASLTTSDSQPVTSSANSTTTTQASAYSSPTFDTSLTSASVSISSDNAQSTDSLPERPQTRSLATVIVPSVLVPIVVVGTVIILGAIFIRRHRTNRSQRLQHPPGQSFLPDDGFGTASHGTGSKNSVSISASDPKNYAPVAQEDSVEVWLPSPLSPHPFAVYSPGSSPPLDSSHWVPAEQGVGERRPSYAHRRTMRVLRALADAEPTSANVSQPQLG